MKIKFIAAFIISAFSALNVHAQCDTTVVHFAFGQWQIGAYQDEYLGNLTSNRKLTGSIRILGYADEPGTTTSNLKIADERAHEILRWLLSSGIKPSQIVSCQGVGNWVKSGQDGEQRKVEIIECAAVPALDRVDTQTQETEVPQYTKIQEPMIVDSGIVTLMKQLQVYQKLELKDLVFYPGTAEFIPESVPALDKLLHLMAQNPWLVISIEGHICCGSKGTYAWAGKLGYELSVDRAAVVRNYLTSGGIAATRVFCKGFGFLHPKVYPEISDDDQQQNRRVEIKVLGNLQAKN